MSHFEWFTGSQASAGWQAGAGDVIAAKQKPQAALLHVTIVEDGRSPADMAILLQAAEGTLFPLIDVHRKALGLQERFRPQLKPDASWTDFIGSNFPTSVDLTKIGRPEWTITRWFGDLGDVSLKKAIEGDPAYQDPRLTIVTEETLQDDDIEYHYPVSHIVANDAVEGHRTHLRYGFVDSSQPAATSPFGESLTKVLNSLTWKTRYELAWLRLRDELHCGFTMSFLGHLSLLNPAAL